MRVLILNSFYYPLLRDKGTGGSVRFCISQHKVLSSFGHEVMHVTCEGSDILFPGEQAVLSTRVDIMEESRAAKSGVTKQMALEVLRIHNEFRPDVILDSCNKRIFTTFGSKVTTPYVFFSHNITPIGVKDTSPIKKMFDRLGICHAGVSQLQNKNYGHIFDEVIKVHLADDEFCVPEIQKCANPGYAIHISRWDKYKAPWVVLNKFLKLTNTMEVHFFTTFDGNDLDGTEEALKKLRANPRVTFHEDTPRPEMLEWMSHATIALGNPIESAGLTALEANQNGVPYFVHIQNPKQLAQEEYLCVDGIKKSIGDRYYHDIFDCILRGMSIEKRRLIGNSTREAYNYESFYMDQIRVIDTARKIKFKTLSHALDLF